MRFSRDLIKHSSIYGVGEILTRMASLFLLPVYTHYLLPADYGVIAIVDLLTGLLAVVIGAGLSAAVSRFHFDTDDNEERSAIWWTGLLFVAMAGVLVVLPCWLMRDQLAAWTLGPEVADGSLFYTLALSTMCMGCIEQIPLTYIRVRKWSGRFVSLAMFRLLLNITLNVSLLCFAGWGVKAILWGNCITSIVMLVISSSIFTSAIGKVRFNVTILKRLIGFGSPLIITAVLSMLMHYADRWLLRSFTSLDEVGIYSLGYRIAQAVNQVVLLPFSAIWGVMIYEIAGQPNAKESYVKVFNVYLRGASLMFFGAALFSRQLIALATTPEYAGAADILPIICLGYLFFGLDDHFRVPVLLQKRTLSLVPVCCVAAVVNLLANIIMIPLWGAFGAAWATVLTFLAYSIAGLYIYRKFDRYPYPFIRSGLLVVGMVCSFLLFRFSTNGEDLFSFLTAGVIWLAWAISLLGKTAFDYFFQNTQHDDFYEEDPENSLPVAGKMTTIA